MKGRRTGQLSSRAFAVLVAVANLVLCGATAVLAAAATELL